MKKCKLFTVDGKPRFDMGKDKFADILPYQERTGGFVEVAGNALSLEVSGCTWVKYRVDEKVIPPMSVKRLLDLRVNSLVEQGQVVSKPERKRMKEEIYQELLPKALVKTTEYEAFHDRRRNWLVVGLTGKRADEFALVLAVAFGVQVSPLATVNHPSVVMTETMDSNRSEMFQLCGFEIGSRCDCKGLENERVTFRGIDQLPVKEVTEVIEDMYLTVTNLALVYQGTGFVLGADLSLSSIKVSEEAKDEMAEVETDQGQVEQGMSVFASTAIIVQDIILTTVDRIADVLGGVEL